MNDSSTDVWVNEPLGHFCPYSGQWVDGDMTTEEAAFADGPPIDSHGESEYSNPVPIYCGYCGNCEYCGYGQV